MSKFLISTIFISIISYEKINALTNQVFCYYDSRTYYREAQAKLYTDDLDPAMSYCTHLIYGYTGLSSIDFTVTSLYSEFESDYEQGNYKKITNLKLKYPTLKILLSVGGGADKDDPEKYNRLLESTMARNAFINSAKTFLRNYGFDGINLAWQFPVIKPKRIRTPLGTFWHGLKKKIGIKKLVDDKYEQHREQFSHLVMEMRQVFSNDDFMLTASVLPNVNSSLYFDTYSLVHNLDYIILHGYDYNTPDRNPKEADTVAPLYELTDRNPELNINYLVTYWLSHGFPAEKILLGISTFGRAWKMTKDSDVKGVPPLCIDGPASEGPYTREKGFMSYPEICIKYLGHPDSTMADVYQHLRRVPLRNEVYAFRLPDHNGERGLWISYEDTESIRTKVEYAKLKNLAGVAVVDLTLDDFKGQCMNGKYPLLKAIANTFNM